MASSRPVCSAGSGPAERDAIASASSLSPPRRLARIGVAVFAALAASGEAQARETQTVPGPDSAGRVARATRATSPIILDGRLDEEAWALAERLTSFTQRYPAEGEPASQPSEVRILYDDERLLIGAELFDSEPDRLVAREMKEDSDLSDDDVFGILLDTYHDRRNGFYFDTNPNGARSDALIYDEGRTESFDWDGVWDVSCRVTDSGWVVEMEIPFRTLYFDPARTNPWGLQIWRGIRRNTEDVYWAPVPRNEDLFRVSRAGELHGLEGIRQGSRLSVKPYALGEATATAGAGDEATDGRGDIGLDARYHLTPNLAAVATINTDFAETEVDEQQVNTTRFPLFFPEKREFFLESTGYFDFGFNRQGPGAPPGVIPFFSRRIGLHAEEGVPIPIQAGVKMSGRMGRYNLGFLSINEDDDAGLPQTNYSVLRLSRDILTRSNWGIIGASKEPVGPDDPFDPDAPLAGTHSNRTYGADLNFSVLENLKFGGSLLQTRTPHVDGGQGAGHAYTYWSDDTWRVEFSYRDIADLFNPEVGFVERTGIEEPEVALGWSWRSETAPVREVEPHARLIYTMDQSHELATRFQHWATTIVLRDGSDMEVAWNPGFDKLTETFVLSEEDDALVPAGSYPQDQWLVTYSSDEGDPVSFSVFSEFGDFFDGDFWSAEAGVVARITRHVRGELEMSRTEIDLPARDDDPSTPVLDPLPPSSFDFTLASARVGLAFTTRVTLDALLQYNSDLEDFSTNLRLNFKYRPGSDIYVVYNESNDTEEVVPGDQLRHVRPGLPQLADTTDRTLTIKWTYLMAF